MSDMSEYERWPFNFWKRTAIVIGGVTVLCIGAGMAGCPTYNVYVQRMDGEAKLAHAQYERQIQVQDAENRLAAAAKLAQVEVTRAQGVAQANKIIGDSLKDNEAYLRYLWITDTLGDKSPTIIYVPTEANMPILEAGRGLGVTHDGR